MLRILHITTDFLPGIGGLERFVRDLAVKLQSRNISSTVLCLNRVAGDERRLPATDVCDGIPVHRVGFLNLKYYKPVLLPLPLLRSADILHVHGIGAHLDFTVTAKPLHRKPIILSTHGGIFHTTNQSTLKNIYFTLVRSLILPRVNRIIASG